MLKGRKVCALPDQVDVVIHDNETINFHPFFMYQKR